MSQRYALISVLCLALPLVTTAQATAANPDQPAVSTQAREKPTTDSSSEPFIVERYDTTVRFENDGTGERELTARVRVNTEAGAQQFRELVFSYNSANEKVEVKSITVRKGAGAEFNRLTPEALKDEPAAAAHDAPAYADSREMHVTIDGLGAGNVLEYDVVTSVRKAVASGQFWFQYSFLQDAVVLDERVRLDLPQGRTFSIKSPGYERIAGKESHPAPDSPLNANDLKFDMTGENGRAILRWQHTNTKHAAQTQAAGNQRARTPDIQLTSFETWDEVARWFASRESGLSETNAATRAKTSEVIQGATRETEKIRAICEFVSKKIRYVDVSFDLTRLSPHSAADVLANGYGDAEDKHILLAAMLKAAGIRANAVLVPYARKLDVEVASPQQFDRVITVVPEGVAYVWTDSTAGVAPFRYVPELLRDKSALLVSASGAGKIIRTPADPPFASTQHVEEEAKITELGKLTGVLHYTLRGDAEFVLRSAFHRTPQSQWRQLAQAIVNLNGMRAEVADVSASDPVATQNPFVLNITFAELNVLDWPNAKARITLPLLTIPTPEAAAGDDQPVKLGTPVGVTVRLKLTLPASVTVQPPVGVAVARDYAEYKSTYRVENSTTVVVERSLTFKARELDSSHTADYLAFTHAVKADQAQTLVVENRAGSASAIPATASADEVFEAGAAALKSGNTEVAIPLLKRACQLEPKHKQAWNALGLAYMQTGKFEDAVGAFRKQIEANPSDEGANNYLGLALDRLQRDDEAAVAFRKQIELNPLDTIAHAALGSILLDQHKYSEAVVELEKGAVLAPDNARLRVSLGRAYLNAGNTSKALEAFQKAIEVSPTPALRNDVAFSLAEKAIELDKAREYAESAIKETAEDLQKTSLSQTNAGTFTEVSSIGDYWDTLGWINFQRGDLKTAERYVGAAWRLNQRGEVGDHLAQVYEKLGEKQAAIHQYALALAAPHSVAETRARLTLLLGGNSEIEDLVNKARPELEKERTFDVKQDTKENASADFLVLLSPDGSDGHSTKVEDIEFLKGSESLHTATAEFRKIDWGTVFPDGSAMKLIRRGTLSCSAGKPACEFRLWLPEQAVQ